MTTAYFTGNDLDLMYGALNIDRWSDLDNNENGTYMASRVDWACELATEYVNSRLLRGPYAVPFDSPYPTLIVNLTAMYAGILLYDGRQVVSADDKDRVSRQRKDFNRFIKQIFRGQLKLFTTTGTAIDVLSECAPFVVADEGSTESTEWEDVIL